MKGRSKTPKQKQELFLSHSSKDRDFVVRLARVLKQHGVRYWYSAAHISGAKQWHDEIGRALGRCDWFLVVLTPSSVRSQWVKRELLFALNDDRYNEKIIPVLRKPCKYAGLSWTLPEFQFVDFTGSFDVGCRQLLRIWKIEYRSPTIGPKRKGKKAG
ncbi:MAG TPA: toll/interleukin-1 receptor domain-containing protein [Candidatus Acidoferrum sp.]|nr:toll/interleukin-1 receptor domain-containing protein [Candidatus Acidoferrum sp.]